MSDQASGGAPPSRFPQGQSGAQRQGGSGGAKKNRKKQKQQHGQSGGTSPGQNPHKQDQGQPQQGQGQKKPGQPRSPGVTGHGTMAGEPQPHPSGSQQLPSQGQGHQNHQGHQPPSQGQGHQNPQGHQLPSQGQGHQNPQGHQLPSQGQGHQNPQGYQPPSQGQGHQNPQGHQLPSQGQGHQNPQGYQPAVQGQGQVEAAPQKSKAQLKAERRVLQEAQRAAKVAKAAGGPSSGVKKPEPAAAKKPEQMGGGKEPMKRVPDHLLVDDAKTATRIAKKLQKQQIPKRTDAQKKVGMFNHLHQYEREVSLTKAVKFNGNGIHPAILKLGLQYAEGVICGSNARCLALLGALKQVIRDYTTPPHSELSRDLDARIKPYISFLNQCRPLSISMGNAIKHLKLKITHIPTETSDRDAKEGLYAAIDQYKEEKIVLAGKGISACAVTKIDDYDTIMVYGYSSLIRQVLCEAHSKGIKFRVVVVDARPKLEGKEMLRRLVQQGIKCSYVLINAASYLMKEVTKVFLGAHALLANGYVMSRVGSSQVALIAKSYNVPVLVCCETYKFCERVQTDSFVFNELGDPDDLVQTDRKVVHLSDWRDMKSLSLLNLVYDVTPSELISIVITELGMVPCTSVPVVLRVKHAEAETT